MDNALLRQSGAVLYLALVFLLLTGLIAATVMDGQILALNMVRNSQFHEEAEQVNSGLLDETIKIVDGMLEANDTPEYPDILCLETSTDSACTSRNISLSEGMQKAAAGAVLDVKVVFYTPAATGAGKGWRSMDSSQVSSNIRFTYFEVNASYDGVASGLSRSNVSVGIESRAQAPLSAQQGGGTASSNAGSKGAGNYKFL